MKELLIWIFCFVLISGCEHGGDFTYKINNKSDYELIIWFKASGLDGKLVDKTINISPNQDCSIYTAKSINQGCYDEKKSFLKWFDTLSIKPKNDTIVLIKDYKIRDNWKFSTNCKSFGAESEYLFEIENTDINKQIK